MDTRVFCAYNLARGVFLSSKVTVADGANEPLKMLKVLVGGLGLDAVSGLWLSPLYAAPVVPRLFPFDLLYLDRHNRVLAAEEILPGVEFPPFRHEIASALLLAHPTLQATQTAPGDRLIIGLKEEVEREIGATESLPIEPIVLNGNTPGGGLRESKSAENGHPVSTSATATPESAVRVSAHDAGAQEGSEIAARYSADDGQSQRAESPVISITEVVLERPLSQQAPTINGQHRGVEDLFSIWMDSPLSASGWIARNGAPEGEGANTPPPLSVLPLPPAPEAATESESSGTAAEAGEATQERFGGAVPGSEMPDTPREEKIRLPGEQKPQLPARRWDIASAAHPVTPKKGMISKARLAQTQAEFRGSTRIAQVPLATAFTIAQYGLWQASVPSVVNSALAIQGPSAGRPAASSGASQASKELKSEADARPAIQEAPESENQTEDLRVSARIPSLSSVAEPSQEKLREPELAAVDKISMPDAEDLKQPTVSGKKTAVVEAVQKKNSAELSTIEDSGATVPARASASKPPGDKEKPVSSPPPRRSFPQPSSVNGSAEQETKPNVSTKQPNANGKAAEHPLSLGMRFKRWLNPVAPTSSDRRKAYRRYVPGMVAHYYTGGAPKPHDVADISMTGIYLLTEDRWMPETMIQMTLQKPCAKGERKQSIAVLAKIVRRGSDGVAAQFVMPESLDPHSHDVQPAQATDRFSLARFI
jgi:hypothetical protein